MSSRAMTPLRRQIGWPSRPEAFETPMIRRCEDALDLSVGQQTPETLRLLISQQIGLEFLMPVALDRLDVDPFAAGDLYAGDLLAACLRASATYWAQHPDQWHRLNAILESLDRMLEALNEHRRTFLDRNPFGAATP